MLGNRGISPLIATVLLIAFSVALGAVVMSYGQAYVEEQAAFVQGGLEVASSACDAVDLQLITISGTPQLCVRDSIVELSLDNGPFAIDGLQARIAGSADVRIVPNVLKQPLDAASSLKTMFSYESVGTPLQVKLTPVIFSGAERTYCSGKSIVVDAPRAC
ncbi:hypothetical protein HY493_00635 [Candidatus Woesearchaeota archaeon]|nr:hypothetical protein [Candidatus Woesearchaeota archaeon]